MLSVTCKPFMPNVIILNVVMLNVVALGACHAVSGFQFLVTRFLVYSHLFPAYCFWLFLVFKIQFPCPFSMYWFLVSSIFLVFRYMLPISGVQFVVTGFWLPESSCCFRFPFTGLETNESSDRSLIGRVID